MNSSSLTKLDQALAVEWKPQLTQCTGSFGEVWKCDWRGGNVAVKKLLENMTQSQLEDFKAEAALLSRLRPHTHIVQFQGVCLQPLCIITEFCVGGSLFTLLQTKKPLQKKVSVKIIKGCAAGMLHLQRERVVHRDLAARNILLTAEFDPKISGFF